MPSSSSDHTDQVWHLFNEAIDLPPEARAAFLDEHCSNDPALRQKVEALLQADQLADDAFQHLDRPFGDYTHRLTDNTIGHYRVLEKLGEGGMGVVYKAQDTKLGRTVALKFLPPHLNADEEATERFIQEARAASALDHANICTIYEIGETSTGQTFIAMAYYEGETLKAKLDQGMIPVEEAVPYAIQMTEALVCTHEASIIHRDIKPANVMITTRGQVKILDFGLAKMHDVSMTAAGTTLGTVSYMSPEQAQGDSVDHRTDLWSFGVVFYEMLAGQRPFQGSTLQAVIAAVLNAEPEPLRTLRADIPPVLNAIVMKALAKDQDRRYQQASQLRDDLIHLRAPVPSTTTTIHTRASDSARRHTSYIAGALLIIIGVLIGYAFLYRPSTPAITETPANPTRTMLAVLPFQNLGPPGEAYFADGITDEIMVRLTGIDALGVIARSSAKQYKSSEKTLQQISSELGVSYILEGTVRWQHAEDKNTVRITPQLIDVSDESLVWTTIYQEDLANIFEVQSDIAERLAEALDLTLLEPERKALKKRSTDKPEAYAAYLQGIEAMNRWTETSLDSALEAFARAVQLDSSFALAHARMAETHLWLYMNYYDRSAERLNRAKTAIDRAAMLDPDLAEVSYARGRYYQTRGDFEGALSQFELAHRQQPGNKDLMVGIASILRRQGDLDKAAHYLERAASLDPRDYNTQYQVALTHLFMHQYSEAERSFDRTLTLAPDWFVAYLFKSVLYMSQGGRTTEAQRVMQEAAAHIGLEKLVTQLLNAGAWGSFRYLDDDFLNVMQQLPLASGEVDSASTYLAKAEYYDRLGAAAVADAHYDSARVVLERLVQRVPDDPYYRAWLGLAYAGVGQDDNARREGTAAADLLPVSEDMWDGTDFLWYLAEIYVMIGDHNAAVEQLRQALSYPGINSRAWLNVEPFWDPLREMPAFQTLLDQSP